MPVTTKAYYKQELARAADLITGKLVLWASIYKDGSATYEMTRVTVEDIVEIIDDGLAPTVYVANPNLNLRSMHENDFEDLVDTAQGIVWLGDTAMEGHVLCGELLTAMVASERLKRSK